jgi:hypothetical protein
MESDIDSLRPRLKLLDRSRSKRVSCSQQDTLAFSLEAGGKLCHRRCLASSIYADDKDRRQSIARSDLTRERTQPRKKNARYSLSQLAATLASCLHHFSSQCWTKVSGQEFTLEVG